MKYQLAYRQWIDETGRKVPNDFERISFSKQAWIHDKYPYNEERIEDAINWIQKYYYLTNPTVEPVKLEPPQKWWLEIIFGYDDEKGNPLIHEFFLNMGRGSAKSTFIAMVLEYMTIKYPVQKAENLIVAYDNLQARHVYDSIISQMQFSPLIHILNKKRRFRTNRRGIIFDDKMNSIMVQTNDEKRAQGGASFVNVFDEVHTYQNNIVESVNTGSEMKRDYFLSIYITSGGTVRGGLYDEMLKRFEGEEEFHNPRSFACLYRLDSIDEIADSDNWSKALPLLDITPKKDAVQLKINNAKNSIDEQTRIAAFVFGLKMSSTSSFLTYEQSQESVYNFEDVWNGAEVTCGIDISLTDDLTAFAFRTVKNGMAYYHVMTFATEKKFSNLEDKQRFYYQKGLDEGSLFLTDKDFIDVNECFAYFDEFVQKHDISIQKIGYDPSRYEMLKDLFDKYIFDKDDENQIRIRQGYAMSDYWKIFRNEERIHAQQFLTWQLLNVNVKVGFTGDVLAKKVGNDNKIDAGVASVMALEAAILGNVNA
jgi:phage terminase large subunit-like protein